MVPLSFVVLPLIAALAGCGGVGSSPAAAPASAVAPVWGASQTEAAGPGLDREARRAWGYARIDAPSALKAGADGSGVEVAVIDGAIKPMLPDIKGRVAKSVDAVDWRRGQAPYDAHASFIAGIIAAKDDGRGMVGVAPKAELLSIDAATACFPGASEVCFAPEDVGSGLDAAREAGADVINLSLGGGAPDVAVLQSMAGAARAGGIVVVAAGNEGGRLTYPAAYAPRGAMRGRAIAVGAIDERGRAAPYSNRPSSLYQARSYLTAPGTGVTGLGLDGGLTKSSGTSFAAPFVAGAAAALSSAFPYLKPEEVVRILLETAEDAGPKGVDFTYGRGILDLGAALAPVGDLRLVDGGEATGTTGTPLDDARLRLGRHLDLPGIEDAVAFDAYGRAYPAGLAGRVERRGRTSPLYRLDAGPERWNAGAGPFAGGQLRLATLDADPAADRYGRDGDDRPVSLGFAFDDAGGGTWRAATGPGANALTAVDGGGGLDPFLALTEAGTGIAGERPLGPATWQTGLYRDDAGALLVRNGLRLKAGRGEVTLAHTWLNEDGGALASEGDGALDLAGGASSQFASAGINVPLGAWTLRGGGTLGHSAITPGDGLVRGLERIVSTAWSLGAERAGVFGATDRLRLSLGQPLRAESATATLTLPVGRDGAGNVIGRQERVSLTPSGRELRLEAGYDLDLDDAATLGAWTWLRRDPDNVEGADDDLGLALAYKRRF